MNKINLHFNLHQKGPIHISCKTRSYAVEGSVSGKLFK